MMVNPMNNNPDLWQSTVPKQMPWMNSYDPVTSSLQFGQQPVQSPDLIQQSITSHSQYQQQPSILSPLTATTITSPVTTKPTSITSNVLFNAPVSSLSSSGVTVTTQSYPIHQINISPTDSSQVPRIEPMGSSQVSKTCRPHQFINSLTHIPTIPEEKLSHNKRSSLEMEDDTMVLDEPPTKQLLSENRLFKQFGSLQLNGNSASDKNDSDDSDDDIQVATGDSRAAATSETQLKGREEFNRYVYLLFKDKKNSESPFGASNSSIDRLAREERDKLSKAVILWTPKGTNLGTVTYESDTDSDEEFRYTDHKDFLKYKPNDSITITEVFDEPCDNIDMEANQAPGIETDDCMME